MIKSYRFKFPAPVPEALGRLDACAGADPELVVETTGDRVSIHRRQPAFFFNGFAPVFVGRFRPAPGGTELRGRFRFHMLFVALFSGFVGLSLYSLANVLQMPDAVPGLAQDWKVDRIRFELQFISACLLAAVFAWFSGDPQRRRIVAMLEQSALAEPGKPARKPGH